MGAPKGKPHRKFTPEENDVVNSRAAVACDAVKAFALSGMQFAMCNYNNK